MSITLSNPNEMRREMARRVSNKVAVLELLRERGAAGATNVELVAVGGMRACGARVPELRAEGHDIPDAINEGGGLFRYVLRGSRTPRPGEPGYLASLVPVASITGRPVKPAVTDSTPAAIGRLF